MLELTVRLIASLAVVVGLMLLLARLVGKRYGARAGAPVQVVHRQQLSRSASVAVLTVGSRVLVVGTTDHQVSLLTELDPEDLVLEGDLDTDLDADLDTDLTAGPGAGPEAAQLPGDLLDLPAARALTALRVPAAPRGSHRAEPAPRRTVRTPAVPQGGALAGSVLSPQTWRQAFAAATGKAS